MITRPSKSTTIFILVLFLVVFEILSNQPATAQEIGLTIQLKDMEGWPGGTRFGIWEGSGWEANLYFNVSASERDIKFAELRLHMYAKTTGYSKAILDNLQLNGYVIEKDSTFAYDWWGSGRERDEWVNWTVSNEYVKTGQNHLFIGLYFTDLDDLFTEDFAIYDISKIVLHVRDATPPNTSPILTGIKWNDDLYVSSISVTLSAEDPLSGVSSTFYRVDSGGWIQYQTPFEVSDEGSHTVYYYSEDKVDNKESEKFVFFRIDISPPKILVEKPADGSCIANPNVAMSWNGNDESGIDHYEILLDGVNVGNISSTIWNFANVEEGRHILSVVAYDQAGHYNEDRATITVDYSSPNVSIVYPNANANLWGVITLKVNATDYLSGIDVVQVHIENRNNENMTLAGDMWVYPLDTSLFEGGRHTIQTKAIDNAGNSETSEVTVVVRALRIETVFSNQSPAEGEIVETRISVTDQDGNAVEEAQVLLKSNGQTVRCVEIGGGLYEKALNTAGLVGPLDIVYKKLEIVIRASKENYNSKSQTYQVTVQRDWSDVLPKLIAALFSGVAAFYLPIPSFARLLGEGRRFSKHFSIVVCFFIGVITGMVAYNLPQFILLYTGIPSILMVVLFSTLGMVLTIHAIIKRAVRKR